MAVSGLTRYWIEFGRAPGGAKDVSATTHVCGVTATSLDDALALVGAAHFRGQPLPPVKRVIADIDLAMLDVFHVGPSVLPPRGGGAR